jgi:hypothetical protein
MPFHLTKDSLESKTLFESQSFNQTVISQKILSMQPFSIYR